MLKCQTNVHKFWKVFQGNYAIQSQESWIWNKVRRTGYNYLLSMCSWVKIWTSFQMEHLILIHHKWVATSSVLTSSNVLAEVLGLRWTNRQTWFFRRVSKSYHHGHHTVWRWYLKLKYCETMQKSWMNMGYGMDEKNKEWGILQGWVS